MARQLHASRFRCRAMVVGAGPAGISALGTILQTENEPGAAILSGHNTPRPVFWADRDFEGGRITQKYGDVPSNTKIQTFLDYIYGTKTFRDDIDGSRSGSDKALRLSIGKLRAYGLDRTCPLHIACRVLKDLTRGLLHNPHVAFRRSEFCSATWDTESGMWTATLRDYRSTGQEEGNYFYVHTPLLILATGSSPVELRLPVPTAPVVQDLQPLQEHLKKSLGMRTRDLPAIIPLDIALSPKELQTLLPGKDDRPFTYGVVGASHSAILVLMFLVNAAKTKGNKAKILWFTRHKQLKYAEYLEDGTIKHDNTGLKGVAADFGRMLTSVLDEREKKLGLDEDWEANEGEWQIQRAMSLENTQVTRDATRMINRVDCSSGEDSERAAMEKHLPKCDFVISAVGFKRDDPGTIWLPSEDSDPHKRVHEAVLEFDHRSGGFTDAKTGKPIPGLYGTGIAFPEKVRDVSGEEELAIGWWKFMKFQRRMVSHWIDATKGKF